MLDIGDFVGIKGHVFTTKVGEISIHVEEFKVLQKHFAIPLPKVDAEGNVHDAFTDPEKDTVSVMWT